MSHELAIPRDERPVVMRSGFVHWIKDATAERIRALLAQQTGHQFIAVSELGITINTADVSGVYTIAEYEDLVKVKQGMFQCAYRRWHGKKEECDCKREVDRQMRELARQREAQEQSRPSTPEERVKIQEIIAGMRASSPSGQSRRPDGMPRMRGPFLKRSALDEYRRKFGAEYKVPEGTRVEEDTGALKDAVATF